MCLENEQEIKRYHKSQSNLKLGVLSVRDLMCPCDKCSYALIDMELVKLLNKLNNFTNVKIVINSCYRCYLHNIYLKTLGYNAHENSYHLSGQAADISLKRQPDDFIETCAGLFPYMYINHNTNFVHVDMFERNKK